MGTGYGVLGTGCAVPYPKPKTPNSVSLLEMLFYNIYSTFFDENILIIQNVVDIH